MGQKREAGAEFLGQRVIRITMEALVGPVAVHLLRHAPRFPLSTTQFGDTRMADLRDGERFGPRVEVEPRIGARSRRAADIDNEIDSAAFSNATNASVLRLEGPTVKTDAGSTGVKRGRIEPPRAAREVPQPQTKDFFLPRIWCARMDAVTERPLAGEPGSP